MTVYWVVADGAAGWVVDRLVAEGRLPAIARLREQGIRASARPPAPNCQTPPSLATLFSGTDVREHGITGFWVPGARGRSLHGYERAFNPGLCRSPMVWQTAAEHGLTSALVHAPWAFDAPAAPDGTAPDDPAAGGEEQPKHLDAAVQAYRYRLLRDDLLELPPGSGARDWQVGPEAWSVRRSPEGVEVTGPHDRTVLPVDGPWRSVRTVQGDGCWLRAIAVDGGVSVLRTGVWAPRANGSNTELVAALRELPVFAGEGLGARYRSGALGRRLADGGTGSAEEVFLSSVACSADAFQAAAAATLRLHRADLVVVYLPMTDDVGHELLGWCDPLSAAHLPEHADRLWEFVARCYGWVDRVVAGVLDRMGPDDSLVLGADHGMAGVTHEVHLNAALVRAGLAVPHPEEGADPDGSRVLYHVVNNGLLYVNQDGMPGGTVPAGQAADLLHRAMDVLSELREPVGGRRVVAGFVDPEGRPVGAGYRGGSVHVVLADDFQPSAEIPADLGTVTVSGKSAAHVCNTGDPRLHATFAATGPGIDRGRDLGVIDNTEPARLVLRRLGLAGARADRTVRNVS